jgi:hypothetical protein
MSGSFMQEWHLLRRLGLQLGTLLIVVPLKADLNPDVVISQVAANFVEIFNRSAQSVSIDGWSVQYTYGPYDAPGR